MEMELRYQLSGGQSGAGELINISTGGLLFHCAETLPVGELLRADLTWPFPTQAGQPVELRVHGIIVRSDAQGTASSISKRHFRVPELPLP